MDVCGKEISSLQKNTTSISEVPNFTIKFLPHVFLILSHGRLQAKKHNIQGILQLQLNKVTHLIVVLHPLCFRIAYF